MLFDLEAFCGLRREITCGELDPERKLIKERPMLIKLL
jgi:hypothetical protein